MHKLQVTISKEAHDVLNSFIPPAMKAKSVTIEKIILHADKTGFNPYDYKSKNQTASIEK